MTDISNDLPSWEDDSDSSDDYSLLKLAASDKYLAPREPPIASSKGIAGGAHHKSMGIPSFYEDKHADSDSSLDSSKFLSRQPMATDAKYYSYLNNNNNNNNNSNNHNRGGMDYYNYSSKPSTQYTSQYQQHQHHQQQSSYRPSTREEMPLKPNENENKLSQNYIASFKHTSAYTSSVPATMRTAPEPATNFNNNNNNNNNNNSNNNNISANNIPQNYSYGGYPQQGRESDQQGSYDMYLCREFLLSLSEQTRNQVEFLSKLTSHIDTEGDIDSKIVSGISGLIFRNGMNSGSMFAFASNHGLPSEARTACDSQSDLAKQLQLFIDSVSQCFLNRKNAYATQIRKLRENCNLAIRKAIQNERAEGAMSLSQYQEHLKRQRETEFSTLQKQVESLEEDKHSLNTRYLELQLELQKVRSDLDSAHASRDAAVAAAIRETKDIYEKEKVQAAKAMMAEHQRVRDETTRQLEASLAQMQSQMDAQERKENEIKAILTNDKDKLAKDCEELRHQNIALSAQLQSERERFNDRMKELRQNHDHEVQKMQAESLRELSLMKAKMNEAILTSQNSEAKLKNEIESILAKERTTQNAAFASESEKREEVHRNDLRRLQAQLEVRHKEDLMRATHMHEQELKRVLRENDRLQRLVGKGSYSRFLQTGTALEGAPVPLQPPQPVENYMRKSQRSAFEAGSSGSGFNARSTMSPMNGESENLRDSVINSTKLTMEDMSTTNGNLSSSKNRWAKLNESLYSQEHMSPSLRAGSRSQTNDPPSTLLVDEALQASKRGHKASKSMEEEAYLQDLEGDKDSLDGSDDDSDFGGALNRSSWSKVSSASRNPDNVDSYLDKLQKYLDGGDS